MTDVMTPEQRHRCMAAIKGKNTRPELMVRKFLFAHGLRFRIHVSKLPGSPDIVLPKYRTAIFIDGCFWHGHEGCRYSHMPASNADFWQKKISRNKKRDAEVSVALREMGYKVIRVWTCQLVPRRRVNTLYMLLREILWDAATVVAENTALAAEPEVPYGG